MERIGAIGKGACGLVVQGAAIASLRATWEGATWLAQGAVNARQRARENYAAGEIVSYRSYVVPFNRRRWPMGGPRSSSSLQSTPLRRTDASLSPPQWVKPTQRAIRSTTCASARWRVATPRPSTCECCDFRPPHSCTFRRAQEGRTVPLRVLLHHRVHISECLATSFHASAVLAH